MLLLSKVPPVVPCDSVVYIHPSTSKNGMFETVLKLQHTLTVTTRVCLQYVVIKEQVAIRIINTHNLASTYSARCKCGTTLKVYLNNLDSASAHYTVASLCGLLHPHCLHIIPPKQEYNLCQGWKWGCKGALVKPSLHCSL